MREPYLLDTPLKDPDQDLLEIHPYARTLAEFIHSVAPPFTIGVYGEWGSGKTSFVRFVEHYLREIQDPASPVLFIRFSAWPHKAAEELWRALVLTLARSLYGIHIPQQEAHRTQEPATLGKRLRQFLVSEALILHEPPTPRDAYASYRELVAKLDAMPESVGRAPARLDPEGAITALASAVVASLGLHSPLVASIRGLLGLDSHLKESRYIRREANQLLREKIESTDQFRDVLRRLFEERALGRRVCVFVDDLDRTMPDVALDLLEAIRIFLGDVPCIFLLAADEDHIGQGLRLRLREVLDGSEAEKKDFRFRKGQEYFEKIIQLGIRVPSRTPEQTHRFISAQFPRWLAATDLLRTALGDNPRRLKQYCNLLHYKYETFRKASGGEQKSLGLMPLFERILSLRAWSPGCLSFLGNTASRSSTFSDSMSRIERCLSDSRIDAPTAGATDLLDGADERGLFDTVVHSTPLYRLFTEATFSQCQPKEIGMLIRLADVAPHAQSVLSTSDGCFQRIIAVSARSEMSSEKLLRDDLVRIAGIYRIGPALLELILASREVDGWTDSLQRVEAALEAGQSDRIEGLPEPQRRLVEAALGLKTNPSAASEALKALLTSPRVSSLLPEELLAFREVIEREIVPPPEKLVSQEVVPDPSGLERDRAVADWVFQQLDPGLRQSTEDALQVRIAAARHLLHLRAFAKLDALSQCWPDLVQRMRTNRSALIALEAHAMQPEPTPLQTEQWWETARRDERLLAFLRLRPLVRDIEPALLARHFSLVEATEVQPARPHSDPSPESQMEEQLSYLNIEIRIRPEDGGALDTQKGFQIRLESHLGQAQEKLAVVWENLLTEFEEALDQALAPDRQGPQSNSDRLTQDPNAGAVPFLSRRSLPVEELSLQLSRLLFPGTVGELLKRLLDQPLRYRILWDVDAPRATDLPIEILCGSPPTRGFLGLTRRYSLVRYLNAPRSLFEPAFAPPLRILAVLPEPQGMAPLNLSRERHLLESAFKPSLETGAVELAVLSSGGATIERIHDTLRSFRPHLFHFMGHGIRRTADGTASLVIESSQGKVHLLNATNLATLLRDSPIRVAVLNACDTGAAPASDAIQSLSGALVTAGLPVVIGTVRPVADEAALLFTRELYRSFSVGYSIEEAVIEGRKALSVERWDWSAYALFSGLRDLSSLRLVGPLSRTSRSSS